MGYIIAIYPYDEFIAGIIAANQDLTPADWRRIGDDVRAEFEAAYAHANRRTASRPDKPQQTAA